MLTWKMWFQVGGRKTPLLQGVIHEEGNPKMFETAKEAVEFWENANFVVDPCLRLVRFETVPIAELYWSDPSPPPKRKPDRKAYRRELFPIKRTVREEPS